MNSGMMFVCLLKGSLEGNGYPNERRGVTLGWVFSCPSLYQTSKCFMDTYAWRDESASELICPPFHGLANEVHLHEPDKSI